MIDAELKSRPKGPFVVSLSNHELRALRQLVLRQAQDER